MKRKILSLICSALPVLAFASCGNGSSDGAARAGSAAVVESDASESENDAVIVGTSSKQFSIVDNLLISDNRPVIVDFNATWCGPCRQFAPIFHSVAEQYRGQALFVSIDTDKYPDIAKAYKVSAIPTLVFIMPGGQVLGSQTGVMPEQQFVEYVNQLVATSAGESGAI